MSTSPEAYEPMKIRPITAGWMTLQGAADYSDYSFSTVKRGADTGELRTVGKGKRRRTRPEWVDEWVISRTGDDDEEDDA